MSWGGSISCGFDSSDYDEETYWYCEECGKYTGGHDNLCKKCREKAIREFEAEAQDEADS